MVSQAEYWKVEEHEPVHPHLRVEMSPAPTRFNRRNADDSPGYVGWDYPNVNVHIGRLTGSDGKNAAKTSRRHRLAASKDKDCDRQPHQYVLSPAYERGKAWWHDQDTTRELTPMATMLAEFP